MAPGQLSYQQMKEIYRYEKINAETEVYGVIADPVGHSLSPLIHNAAFDALGLNKVYVPFRVPPEDLTQFMHDCRELGIKGLSVTIPHKEEILQHIDEVRRARRRRSGPATRWSGRTTTASATTPTTGPRWTASTRSSAATSEQSGLQGQARAGAGRRRRRPGHRRRPAAPRGRHHDRLPHARAGRRAGARSARASRSPGACGTRSSADLIVNCTPVGMHPNLDETPFEPKYLQAGDGRVRHRL